MEKVRYYLEPRTRNYVKEYEFLTENLYNRYEKQLLKTAKKQD